MSNGNKYDVYKIYNTYLDINYVLFKISIQYKNVLNFEIYCLI